MIENATKSLKTWEERHIFQTLRVTNYFVRNFRGGLCNYSHFICLLMLAIFEQKSDNIPRPHPSAFSIQQSFPLPTNSFSSILLVTAEVKSLIRDVHEHILNLKSKI